MAHLTEAAAALAGMVVLVATYALAVAGAWVTRTTTMVMVRSHFFCSGAETARAMRRTDGSASNRRPKRLHPCPLLPPAVCLASALWDQTARGAKPTDAQANARQVSRPRPCIVCQRAGVACLDIGGCLDARTAGPACVAPGGAVEQPAALCSSELAAQTIL